MQSIGPALAGVLQKAVSLQQARGDDFVSVEHLLEAVTQVAPFTLNKGSSCATELQLC